MTSDNGLATVDQLFAPTVRRYRMVDLPVSGLTVRIQSLTERELSTFQSDCWNKAGTAIIPARRKDASPRLIVLCVVDANGNRIMNATHIPMLMEWDSGDSNALHRECMEHCGLREDGIEALEKNSDATPAGG